MRKLLCAILCVLSVMGMVGCSKQLNMNTVLNEPNFVGIVTEVNEKSILVKVNEDEDAYKSSDLINVSLEVEIKDGLSEYDVGDEVRVYYDGSIAESYPAQVSKVYAITIVNEFDGESDGFQNGEIVHEDESVQIIRSMMNLDLTSMTVADFNERIQAMCVEADTNVFEVISDAFDQFGVYDDTGEFVGTVFSDRELETFMQTTLSYSAQEIFGEPAHLGSIMYMTLPGFTAKELHQKKEQMSFDEWNSFFEEHIAEINTWPVLFYSIEADIANPDTLLVSDRDSRIDDTHAAIIDFVIEMDEETAKADNMEDIVNTEFEKISDQQSDSQISIKCSMQGLERDLAE
ncbi:YobA family protein [Christensenellaceae bacterium OttesenSCG-928-K19]|nr:YobA family protein [Christensenellaceae bacterium OttesenSCG-928-K19]